MKRQYDVLLLADHFVIVTTIIMDDMPTDEMIEQAAYKQLSDEYGDEWFNQTLSFINDISIEPSLIDWADADNDESDIPEAGDPADAGIDGA